MNCRSSERCGSPSLRPPFSLRSGGSIRARPFSTASFYNHGVMSTDERQAAQSRLTDLLTVLKGVPQQDQLSRLIDETEALARAVAAFHLEGIRFRIYNV